ncbi:MAG: hypothetical protein R3B47_16795 [Bacteroidia bacterium]
MLALWIAVDIIAIGIYYAKDLYFTFLYVGYLILATTAIFSGKN